MKLQELWGLARETIQSWSEDRAPRLAAALAYYTIFSLAPLLVLVIAITGFIVGYNAPMRAQVINQVQNLAGQQAARVVEGLIKQTSLPSSSILASVIGIITLLLGATGLFAQLQDALNTIWKVNRQENSGIWKMLKNRSLSFSMVFGLSFLLLISFLISTGLSVAHDYIQNFLGNAGLIIQVLNLVFSIAITTLAFATIFKILPDAEIDWGDVWIGALVTAVLFTIGKSILSLYLATSAAASAYGAAGSLVILLLWIYYSAQILFIGAEFTQVYSRRFGSRLIKTTNGGPPQPIEKGSPYAGQATIPVVGQPAIYTAANPVGAPHRLVEDHESIRYEPPNPARVLPVIAFGSLAAIYTFQRLVRRVILVFKNEQREN